MLQPRGVGSDRARHVPASPRLRFGNVTMRTMTILRNGAVSSCGTSHDGSVTLVPAWGRGRELGRSHLLQARAAPNLRLHGWRHSVRTPRARPPSPAAGRSPRGPRPPPSVARGGAGLVSAHACWHRNANARAARPKPLRGFLGVPRLSRSSPGHRVLSRLHVQMRTCPPAGARWPPVTTRPPHPETPLKCGFFYFYFSM